MPQLLGKQVGAIGYGMMGLTWRDPAMPYAEAFKALRTALARGSNFWNGGDMYGPPDANSLHLLRAYFEQYPEDASKVVVSIKGSFDHAKHLPVGDRAGLTKNIEADLATLGPKGKIDLFEIARLDQRVEVEETVGALADLVKAGKLGGISMTEAGEKTIRRAAKVAKIDAVECEVSLYSTDIWHNGVAKACAELNIPIIAYSPLCRGFLTGDIKKPEDVPPHIQRFPRFQGDSFYTNLKLAEGVQKIAAAKGVRSTQVAIAWVLAQSERNGNPVIIPIPGSTTPERVIENTTECHLNETELKDIDNLLANCEVAGGRYPDAVAHLEYV